MDGFKGIKVEFIQLSNKNIFDVLEKDLSKKLRFEDISIEAILGKYLCNNDIEIIKCLYEKDKINMELLISLISKISNKLVKQEFIKVLVLYEYVKTFYQQIAFTFHYLIYMEQDIIQV